MPALAVLWVQQYQESPSLLETSFSAAATLLRDAEPEPLGGVLVLAQGTGTALLQITPEVLPLHWAGVHR